MLLCMNISWVAGKSAQIADTEFEVPGSVKINSAALWGWDPTVGKIKATRFTSHEGVWSETMTKKGDAGVSEYSGANLNGAHCIGTTTFTFSDNDTMVMADTGQKVDGKTIPDVTSEFKRVGVPSQPAHHEKLKELGSRLPSYHLLAGEAQDVPQMRNPQHVFRRSNFGHVQQSNCQLVCDGSRGRFEQALGVRGPEATGVFCVRTRSWHACRSRIVQ